jgi:hypothetical protein
MKFLTIAFFLLAPAFLISPHGFAAPSVTPHSSDEIEEKNLDDHDGHDHHEDSKSITTHRGHVHGQANAKIVFAHREISIEFDLPSGDLLSSEEAVPLLRQHTRLFDLQPAQNQCHLQESSFKRAELPGGHADFVVSFHWACKQDVAIESIDFQPFFQLASKIDHIEATIIAGGQIFPKATLKKNSTLIKIKKK